MKRRPGSIRWFGRMVGNDSRSHLGKPIMGPHAEIRSWNQAARLTLCTKKWTFFNIYPISERGTHSSTSYNADDHHVRVDVPLITLVWYLLPLYWEEHLSPGASSTSEHHTR